MAFWIGNHPSLLLQKALVSLIKLHSNDQLHRYPIVIIKFPCICFSFAIRIILIRLYFKLTCTIAIQNLVLKKKIKIQTCVNEMLNLIVQRGKNGNKIDSKWNSFAFSQSVQYKVMYVEHSHSQTIIHERANDTRRFVVQSFPLSWIINMIYSHIVPHHIV